VIGTTLRDALKVPFSKVPADEVVPYRNREVEAKEDVFSMSVQRSVCLEKHAAVKDLDQHKKGKNVMTIKHFLNYLIFFSLFSILQ